MSYSYLHLKKSAQTTIQTNTNIHIKNMIHKAKEKSQTLIHSQKKTYTKHLIIHTHREN